MWRSNGTTAGTQLLKDIYPDEEGSSINLLAVIENTLFFWANDGEHGYELWKSQGTTSSTQLVKDILPGPQGSGGNGVVLDDVLIFTANGGQGTELYRSEGTDATTSLFKDINPNVTTGGNPFTSNPRLLTVAGNLVFLAANDGTNGNELWKTNGTTAGTLMVKDISPGQVSTNIDQIKSAGNLAFFECNGLELWCSDGTEAGTILLEDLSDDGTSIQFMEAVNGFLYFIVRESNVKRNLWKSDGTPEGTEKVGGGINTREFFLYENTLYFKGNNRLWKADGENEVQISDLSIGESFAGTGGFLYFVANEGGSGNGLWKTDGTVGGEVLVKEVTDASYMDIAYLKSAGNYVYFTAETNEFGNEIWVSDGTEEGTFLLLDGYPGEENGFRTYYNVSYGVINNSLFFIGRDDAHGYELWRSQGTLETTQLVKDINSRTKDFQLSSSLLPFNNHVYFLTDEGLWRTDASSENTRLVHELTFGSGLNLLNGNLIFSAQSDELSRTIWTSDGTTEGTRPLFNAESSTTTLMLLQDNLPQLNGEMFFYARDNEHGSEVWKTDGTAEGTNMLKDINTGTEDAISSFSSQYYAVLNNTIFFMANDGISGYELWKSDGTEEGTRAVSDINPFGSCGCNTFTLMNNEIYFSADDGTAGFELWKTDGTTEGTKMVIDLAPGDKTGYRFDPAVVFRGELYFSGSDNEHGEELWKTDGTEEGTVMVKDINPSLNGFVRSSNPRNFLAFDDVLYFNAIGESGQRMWQTDGTEGGTVQSLAHLSDYQTALTLAGDQLLFSVNDGEHGFELWRAGTDLQNPVQMADIVPGSGSSGPVIYGYYNEALYFTAIDNEHGRELWTLSPLELQVDIEASADELCNPENEVTFTASVSDAAITPEFTWIVNNQELENVGEDIFSSSGFNEGDEIKVLAVAGNEMWVLEDSVFSNHVTISYSLPEASIIISGNTLTASGGTSYRWFFEGELLPDVTQNITVTKSGSYQAEVTNTSGCSSLSAPVILEVNITGIADDALAGKISVYPNPATDFLYIDSGVEDAMEVRFFDLKGNMVYREKTNPLARRQVIPLNQFEKGVYLVRFVSELQTLQIRLIKL